MFFFYGTDGFSPFKRPRCLPAEVQPICRVRFLRACEHDLLRDGKDKAWANEIQWDPMKKVEHRLFIKKTCTWQRTTKTRWKLHVTSSEWPSASYDTIHPYGFIPLCNMHQSYTHLYSPHIFCAPLIFHEIQLEMSHIKNYTKDQQRSWSCVPSFCSCNTNTSRMFSMDFQWISLVQNPSHSPAETPWVRLP